MPRVAVFMGDIILHGISNYDILKFCLKKTCAYFFFLEQTPPPPFPAKFDFESVTVGNTFRDVFSVLWFQVDNKIDKFA